LRRCFENYYVVRVRNTGATSSQNTEVRMSLDSFFLFEDATIPYSMEAGEMGFDQIMLPDSSTNEPASHGFFKFRMKPLAELDYGTSIPNQAAIYFDFNEPIFTNDAIFVLQKPSATHSPGQWATLSVYPNPVGEVLFISFPPEATQSGLSISIVDLLGRTVQPPKPLLKDRLEVSGLTAGVYCLLVWKEGRLLGRSRFVKQ